MSCRPPELWLCMSGKLSRLSISSSGLELVRGSGSRAEPGLSGKLGTTSISPPSRSRRPPLASLNLAMAGGAGCQSGSGDHRPPVASPPHLFPRAKCPGDGQPVTLGPAAGQKHRVCGLAVHGSHCPPPPRSQKSGPPRNWLPRASTCGTLGAPQPVPVPSWHSVTKQPQNSGQRSFTGDVPRSEPMGPQFLFWTYSRLTHACLATDRDSSKISIKFLQSDLYCSTQGEQGLWDLSLACLPDKCTGLLAWNILWGGLVVMWEWC